MARKFPDFRRVCCQYPLLIIWTMVFLSACGASGEFQKKPGQGAADAQKVGPDDPERLALLREFDTPDIAECRDEGFFYDRRAEECVSELKTKGFPCTRDGILQAFNATGSQITQILDRSLGNLSVPGDKGEGYVIDQCGKSSSGRLMVDLIKKGPDGKLQIRELETTKSVNKK